MKRIAAEAYDALADALAAVMWNKQPFERMVRALLRDHPELLAGLNFNEPKRTVSTALVDRLTANEYRYHDLTLAVMRELAEWTTFPNLERVHDDDQRKMLLRQAEAAVGRLKKLAARHADEYANAEKLKQQIERLKQTAAERREFDHSLDELKQRFLELQGAPNAQKRGQDFERFLHELFDLFGMEPRLAYDHGNEQIDGALTFDTDDYILEARWRAEPVSRADADIFATKVRRKGKNALGIFISATTFASTAVDQYREGTPFLAIDGQDLYMVLDRRVRLDELILAKRRYANETGSCYLPATRV